MDRILLTGAGGFIGTHVVTELEQRGISPVRRERRWSNIDEIAELLGSRGVQGCIHLAWYAHPADYLFSVDENARSLWNTVELAGLLDRVGCEAFVAAGTGIEYAPADTAVTESQPIRPRTPYASAKALCHSLLDGPLKPTQMRVSWARLFNVIGPGEHPDRVVSSVTRSLLAGRPIELTHGRQVRDYIDVRDVASALVELLFQGDAGAYNVSTGKGVPLRTVLETVAEKIGGQDLLKFGTREVGREEQPCIVGDSSKLRETTGWQPRYDLNSTAAAVGAWWRTQAPRDSQ